MHVCLHEDIDAPDSVKLNLVVLVVSPVAEFDEICSAGVVLLVAWGIVLAFRNMSVSDALTFGQNNIFIEPVGKSPSFVRFNPRVVVNCNVLVFGISCQLGQLTFAFNVATMLVAMEPDI